MIIRLVSGVLLAATICGTVHAAALCPAASRKWLGFVDDDPTPVLELDIADCERQTAETAAIIDCAGDYMDPAHPVYDQGIALNACAGKHRNAHYFNGVSGKPYPAHDPEDLAHPRKP